MHRTNRNRSLPRAARGLGALVVVAALGAPSAWADVAPEAPAAPDDLVADVDGDADADVLDTINDDDEDEFDDSDSLLPFSVTGSVSTSFGLGTVFRDNFTTTDSVLANFGLGLSYPITSMISASMNMSLSKYLTPHGSTKIYESRFGDIGLGLAHSSIYVIPVAEVNISAGLDATVPTSDASRFEGLRTAIGGNLGLSRSFGDFTLSYGFGVNKNFHRATSAVFNNDRYDIDVLLRTDDVSRVSDRLVSLDTGVLGEWSVSNSLSLGYRFWDTGLGASLGLSLSDSFTYDVDALAANDEFTSPYAEPGRGHSQFMSGRIGLSYRFLEHFSTGLSMSTGQQPKTADNSSVRFPFFDTQSGNLQYTSLALSFSVSY